MKKRGFTLIELLAVIVVLAIIALIATPIVLNIIEDAKNNAILRSAEKYVHAVELSISQPMLDESEIEDGIYDVLESGNICITGKRNSCSKELAVAVSGDIPNAGMITITEGEISDVLFRYEDKVVVNDENDKIVFSTAKNAKSFANDSWETIFTALKLDNTSAYNVGDEKEITLTGEVAGTYTVRIANKSTDDTVCNTGLYSQTACGFVIEFVDMIGQREMSNEWVYSLVRTYLNETVYDALPDVLKENIIDTIVVSGSNQSGSNKATMDKVYLLSPVEIFGVDNYTYDDRYYYSETFYDNVKNQTRQLDYYKNNGSMTINEYGMPVHSNAVKSSTWWLRSLNSNSWSSENYVVGEDGSWGIGVSGDSAGLAPAFRIG